MILYDSLPEGVSGFSFLVCAVSERDRPVGEPVSADAACSLIHADIQHPDDDLSISL
jgi:hypothetical protein